MHQIVKTYLIQPFNTTVWRFEAGEGWRQSGKVEAEVKVERVENVGWWTRCLKYRPLASSCWRSGFSFRFGLLLASKWCDEMKK